MVEHVPAQTSQPFLDEEASTGHPAENAEDGAQTAQSTSLIGAEAHHSEQIGTEGAESRKPDKVRSAPSRSFLMKYIEGEKNVGKNDGVDEAVEGRGGRGEKVAAAQQVGEEETNFMVGGSNDDAIAPERGGRRRRRVSKEDIVNAALKKEREEREAAEEERMRGKKRRRPITPKSPLDCLTPRERLEANNATILFSDSNPEELGDGRTTTGTRSLESPSSPSPIADKAARALEQEDGGDDEEEETFSQEQKRMKMARAQSRTVLDETTSAEEGSSVIFPTEELFEESEEDGRGRRLVVKSSYSKRKKKLDLTGGGAKIRSPLLQSASADKRSRLGVLRGKAAEEPSQLSATIPMENVAVHDGTNSQFSATIPLENNRLEDDEDLPDIPSSPRDLPEPQTSKALSSSVLHAKEGEESVSGSDDSDIFEVSGTPQAKNSTFRDKVKRLSAGRKRMLLYDQKISKEGEDRFGTSGEVKSPKPPTRNSSTDSNEPSTVILDKSTENEDDDPGAEVEMSQTAPARGPPSTSESVADVQRKFVLMMSGLDSKQRSNVNMYAAKLGCSVKGNLDQSVTHVVIGHDDGMRCERTLKYFQVNNIFRKLIYINMHVSTS